MLKKSSHSHIEKTRKRSDLRHNFRQITAVYHEHAANARNLVHGAFRLILKYISDESRQVVQLHLYTACVSFLLYAAPVCDSTAKSCFLTSWTLLTHFRLYNNKFDIEPKNSETSIPNRRALELIRKSMQPFLVIADVEKKDYEYSCFVQKQFENPLNGTMVCKSVHTQM